MQSEELAKQLFLTDWPNDKWDRFKDGDHAKERYMRMADTAIAALSTDAEPVATVAEIGVGGMRVLVPHPPGSTQHLPIGTKLYAKPVKTAPAVAVKADLLRKVANTPVSPESRRFTDTKAQNEVIGYERADWMINEVLAALSAQVQDVAGWQSMDSAPKDGKHCLLAVKSSCFVYAIQGAFMSGKWENAAGLESEPLCWMPLTRIPLVYLPWTEEFAASSPAPKHGEEG